MNSGLPYAALAFVAWGLYPLYFLKIASVPPLEVVLQRSVWSLVFVLVLLALLRRWDWLRPLAAQPRRLGLFALSALLVSEVRVGLLAGVELVDGVLCAHRVHFLPAH